MPLPTLKLARIAAVCLCLAVGAASAYGEPAIRKLEGKHLTLLTDVPASPEVDELVHVFDAAVALWCERFKQPIESHAAWRVRGYLMQSRERFAAAGHIPERLPDFPNGFSWNDQIWLYDQPSAYYRRHLLLHEGTHSFMNAALGSVGPPWYAEGMAELLATHRWQDGTLTLAYFPRERREVPMLNRIQMIQRDSRAGRTLSLPEVIAFDKRAHLRNETYGWCWGAAVFLDSHPQYRQDFRALANEVRTGNFTRAAEQLLSQHGQELADEWQIFICNVDYGYDFERMAVRFAPGKALLSGGTQVEVAADHGWQSSGVALQAGRTYRLRAAGRYQIVAKPRVWWCEPGGVTIAYYHGMPLGMLQAVVQPQDRKPPQPSVFQAPLAVGLDHALTPDVSGTLYLRINDAAGRLADNKGSVTVSIQEEMGERREARDGR